MGEHAANAQTIRAELQARVAAESRAAVKQWSSAEKELDRRLREVAKPPEEDERVLSPLRRNPHSVGKRDATALPRDEGGVVLDPFEEESARAQRAAARAERVGRQRERAFEERAKRLRQRASNTAGMLADHGKRKLRTKVIDILTQVQKGEELRRNEARARKFRDQQLGKAPAGEYIDLKPVPSPRRTALLDELTLEELMILRNQSSYYLSGPAPSSAEGSMASLMGSSRTFIYDEEAMSALVDFFTPTREERALSLVGYLKHLRTQLEPETELQQNSVEPGSTWSLPSWAGGSKTNMESCEETLRPHRPPASSYERMPCLGRHPATRADEASPTLAKVKQVYHKRDAAEAKLMQGLHDTMMRRTEENDFKVKEQQRDVEIRTEQQREHFKARFMEAEERRLIHEARRQKQLAVREEAKLDRLRLAAEIADDAVERRRDKAAESVKAWEEGLQRATSHQRFLERKKELDASNNFQKYMERLERVGIQRHAAAESQAQQNDRLKTRIQGSLVDQLLEQHRADSLVLAEELAEKQERATLRRHQLKNTRYNLLEKALGSQSLGFDMKHSVSAEQRHASWRAPSQEFASLTTSWSDPQLSQVLTQSLSPSFVRSETLRLS